MLIQWDIVYGETEITRSSILYLQENDTCIIIADNHNKLYDEGIRLLEGRANVSIKFNQVIVNIHKLEYKDHFLFKVVAYGGPFDKIASMKNKTFTVENVEGNLSSSMTFVNANILY